MYLIAGLKNALKFLPTICIILYFIYRLTTLLGAKVRDETLRLKNVKTEKRIHLSSLQFEFCLNYKVNFTNTLFQFRDTETIFVKKNTLAR